MKTYDPAAYLRDNRVPLSPPSSIRKDGATYTNTEPPTGPTAATGTGASAHPPTTPGTLPAGVQPISPADHPQAELLRKIAPSGE
jgi:hypothetical protein